MTAARTDTRLGALYRRIARKRGKQKAIVAVSRVICEIAWILICDPAARYEELGPDYYSPAVLPGKPGTRSATSSASTPARRSSSPTRSRPDPALKLARGQAAGRLRKEAKGNQPITRNILGCHATYRNLRRSLRPPQPPCGGSLAAARCGGLVSGQDARAGRMLTRSSPRTGAPGR
jgi:hypothetical protein